MRVAINRETEVSYRQALLRAIQETPDDFDTVAYLRAVISHPAMAPFHIDDYWFEEGGHLFLLWKTVVHYRGVVATERKRKMEMEVRRARRATRA